MELAKLNNNLSDTITNYNKEEQRERELRKDLIDNIIYIQNPTRGEKEVAYFEYGDDNSKIAKDASAL